MDGFLLGAGGRTEHKGTARVLGAHAPFHLYLAGARTGSCSAAYASTSTPFRPTATAALAGDECSGDEQSMRVSAATPARIRRTLIFIGSVVILCFLRRGMTRGRGMRSALG